MKKNSLVELPKQKEKFTFIDLFAGIGGMRIAFSRQGGECVFSSEWDKYAQKNYFDNFKEVLSWQTQTKTNRRGNKSKRRWPARQPRN
jgi:site-specific DNA-cytosine methylase